MTINNYNNILEILKDLGIDFLEIGHLESHSCDESKRFRDEQGLE